MYGLMGLGVLTKGPVGVVLPTAVIGMFLLIVQLPSDARAATCSTWIGRWLNWLRPFAPAHFLRVCWQMRPLTALLVVAAVAAPWYLWVGLRTHGEFLRIFLLEHNLGRAAQVMEGHQGSVFFYPLAMLVGFFPWSVFLVPTLLALISGWRRYDERRPGYLLACCWIGVYVVLFSCARTKLPSYVTPCYPALALLTGCFLEDWTKERVMLWRLWPRLAFGALGLIGAILIAVVPLAARRFLPGEEGLGLIGAIPLAGAIVGWLLLRSERRQAAAMSFTAMAALFTVTLCGFVAQRIDRHQHNHRLLAAIDRHGRNPRIGAFGCLEPTWIFYGRRPVQELAVGQSASSALPAAGEFFGDGEDRFIITTDRQWPTLRERLPTTAAVLAECPFLFRSERLLLVGRARPLPSVAARPDKDVGGNRR
jgi:4-amino-4-deoxy-L-arabinose transferase-like glycosyltransferase